MGSGIPNNTAATIVKSMAARGLTVSAAESCTGGLVSERLTAVPGSSSVYLGGVVCYTNEVKHRLLNVPISVLEGDGAPGAVSEPTAVLLAEHVRALLDTDYGISITGVAGPASSEGKPVGLVYVGLAERAKDVECRELNLSGDRETIRKLACEQALDMLWKKIDGQ
ncbi:MAG: damage-inducible protein CinA [Paenibacillaceae bacterium]|jgi:nicotinamide-nucleotide amidase|nr:damage-inducible protein CinA [Paenibacillaceae bacterium]